MFHLLVGYLKFLLNITLRKEETEMAILHYKKLNGLKQ